MRLDSKTPKGKKNDERKKKLEVEKSAAFNHWAMQPLRQYTLKINSVEESFSAIRAV